MYSPSARSYKIAPKGAIYARRGRGIRFLQNLFRFYEILFKISRTSSNPQIIPRIICSPCSLRSLRRERDSNPRRAFTLNGFQDRRLQPLSHPSKDNRKIVSENSLKSKPKNLKSWYANPYEINGIRLWY